MFMKSAFCAFVFLLMSSVSFASEATQQTEDLQSAEEIEALMSHLGLFDMGAQVSEGGDYQVQQRRGNGYRRPPQRRPPNYRRPPHRRPPHYRRPPYRRPPQRRAYQAICYADNLRGQRYSWVAWNSRVAQAEALNQCYLYSRQCFAVGCYIY